MPLSIKARCSYNYKEGNNETPYYLWKIEKSVAQKSPMCSYVTPLNLDSPNTVHTTKLAF